MNFENFKKACSLFVENFSNGIKIYLFGSSARGITSGKNNLSKSSDVDIFFEVEPGIFLEYQKKCQNDSVNFLTGKAFDPMDFYWVYHSPKIMRLETIYDILEIDETLGIKIIKIFKGNIKSLDLLMLPFDWRENKEILEAINSQDPNFSKSIQKDAILLFEKTKPENAGIGHNSKPNPHKPKPSNMSQMNAEDC